MPVSRTPSFLALALLFACTPDPGENTAPTATIRSPADGALVTEGYGVELVGMIGDDQHVPEDLTVVWSVDGTAVCEHVVGPDGVTSCVWVAVLGGGAVQLEVTDPDGATGSDSLQLEVQAPNQTPSCALTEPTDGATFATGDTVTLRGTVQDDDDELDVVFASDLDGELGEAEPDAKGSVELEAATLSPGEHALTMTATDPHGSSCSAGVTITVQKEDTGHGDPPDTDTPDPDTDAPKPDTATPDQEP